MNKRLKPIGLAVSLVLGLAGWQTTALAGGTIQRPDSGIILQQTEPTKPALPNSNDTGLQQFAPEDIADSTSFTVKRIEITGNTRFDTATLHALVKDAEGTALTLSELKKVAARITTYYREQGFPLSRAVIPAQSIDAGVVQFEVIEARLGEVSIKNESRVSDRLIQSTSQNLVAGEEISQASLERTLLLLNDLPGTNVNADLSAGAEKGLSNLNVTATAAPMLAANVIFDRYGNRFINRERLGANVSLFNPLGLGDVLGVSLTTTGSRMKYGAVNYSLTLNGAGTRVGGSYSALDYVLGDNLTDLKANGQAQTSDIWVRHPFIRTAQYNLSGMLNYNYTALEDRLETATINNKRNVDSWSGMVNADFRDGLFGGGVNSMSIQYTNGQVDINDNNARVADLVTAQTAGNFRKWNINLNRLQAINAKTTLWLSASAQMAEDNLDSSQKMVFGGPFSVRAYDTGAISGDNGTLATIELRRTLANYHGVVQGIAFADVGRVEVNQDRWATATGDNSATLSGVGLGVNWYGNNQWNAKLFAATSTGSRSDLTEDGDRTIAWMELSKGF